MPFGRDIDICYETVRFWWNRIGPLFAAEIIERRIPYRWFSQLQWYLAGAISSICSITSMPYNRANDTGEVEKLLAEGWPTYQTGFGL